MPDLSPVLIILILTAVVVVGVLVVLLRQARHDADQQRALADRYHAVARTNETSALREQVRQVAVQERASRAVEGEWSAPALLASAGYEVLARQVAGSWTVRANGEPKTFGLRADYLVARDGRRFIAEVKTGRLAPNLAHGPTRRQLLEYGAAFDVDGVLLVDADRESITHVEIDVFAVRHAAAVFGPVTEASASALPLSRGLPVGALLLVAAVSFGSGIAFAIAMTR